MWQTALTVLVTYSLGMAVCLNSNGIRTSKEILESLEQVRNILMYFYCEPAMWIE
jgi:hypothetical protein